MSSTHGPQAGLRSQMEARRQRQALLTLDAAPGQAGVIASADTVARLVAAATKLGVTSVQSVNLDLGDGVKAYTAGDIEVALCLCCEAFERFDAAGPG